MKINRVHIGSFTVILLLVMALPTVMGACSTKSTPKANSTLASIGITCPTGLVVGSKIQFNAIGTYSDGSTSDISDLVTWTSSNTQVLTIAPGGLVTGVGIGTTNIKASFLGVTSPDHPYTISK